MIKAYNEVKEASEKHKISLRLAAHMMAVRLVVDAEISRKNA